MTAQSATMPEAQIERDDGGSGSGRERHEGALTDQRKGADETTSDDGSADDSSSEATESESPAKKNDRGKGKAVETADDDNEDDDTEEGEDDGEEEEEEEDDDGEDDDDEDDDEGSDDEDEEPRLKYARLTTNLGGLYRNGDATSAFLVAGDKMIVGTHNGNIVSQCTCEVQPLTAN